MTASLTELSELSGRTWLQHSPMLSKYVNIYEAIHQNPELPLFERETANLVAAHLATLSSEVFTSIGGHGVVGVLRNGSGRTVLLRSELDALPICEETNLPDASTKLMIDEKGREQPVMHACGHDIHIVALLGAAEFLYSSKDHWSGTVIFLFQPIEEYVGGAKAMVSDGLYHVIPKPDIMLAQHVSIAKGGKVGVRSGVVLPGAKIIRISLKSYGTAINPQNCGNLVAMASHLLGHLQHVTATEFDPKQYATLICRQIATDEQFVKPPDRVDMILELRTTDAEVRKRAISVIERTVYEECLAAPGRIEASISSEIRSPITHNDRHSAEILQESFKGQFRDNFYVPEMVIAGEDFSWLGPDIPYVYWFIGGTNSSVFDEAEKKNGLGELHPYPHSPYFAPDPTVTVWTGMTAMSLAALTFLELICGKAV